MTTKRYVKTLVLPSGTRKYFYGKTKKEAQDKRDEIKRLIRSGIDVENNITFGELAQLWYNMTVKGSVGEATASNIRGYVNNHMLPSLSAYKVNEIRLTHLDGFSESIKGLEKSTQRLIISRLRSIFAFAIDNNIIVKSPVPRKYNPEHKEESEEPEKFMTKAQTETLLRAVSGTPLFMFVVLGLNTGMRRGELLGLTWDDVDFDNLIIHVRWQKAGVHGKLRFTDKLKTKKSRRDIPITAGFAQLLRIEKAKSNSRFVVTLAGKEVQTVSDLSRLLNKLNSTFTPGSKLIGQPIPGARNGKTYKLDFHFHPHMLRHTYITRLFESGLDIKEVQYLAGHSNIKTTLAIYTHYDRATRKEETAEKVRNGIAAAGF